MSDKMYQFEKIRKIAFLAKDFIELYYGKMPRNSGKCHDLLKEVVKVKGIVDYLQEQTKKYFDFTLTSLLPKDFVKERELEEKKILGKLLKALNPAYSFLTQFVIIRQKKREDNGEGKFVAKKWNKSTHVRNFNDTLKKLSELATMWYRDVRDRRQNEERKRFEESVKRTQDTIIKSNFTFPGTVNLMEEFKGKIRTAKDFFDKKRVKILIPVLEDINGELKDKEINTLLKQANKLMAKKGKTKRGRVDDEDEDDDVPEAEEINQGLTSVGPFGIKPVSEKVYEKYLHFSTSFEEPSYTLDLTSLGISVKKIKKDKKKKKPVKGKISPLNVITMRDELSKAKAKIPDKAHFQSFVYPKPDAFPPGVSDLYAESELVAGLRKLMEMGGFVYFDKDKNFVGVNALEEDGTDIYFDGPHKLGNDKDGLTKLYGAARMADVTYEAWKKEGVAQFGWVNPKELGTVNHGALLFVYENTKWEPTYFDVINVGTAKLIAQKDSYTKLKQVLKN